MSSPELRANVTWSYKQAKGVMIATVLLLFCVFMLCVGILLHALAKLSNSLDTPRYLLFKCMLVNDSIQMMSSVLLFMLATFDVNFALFYCVPMIIISTASFLNSPLILATMSVERFVAIFYPLRRPAAWRSDRIWVIILAMWLLSYMSPVLENAIGDPRTLPVWSEPVRCNRHLVNITPAQAMIRIMANGLVFSLMAVLIIWTYICIMVQTRKLRRTGDSGGRAQRTVLIHAAQLLLCGLAFTIPISETLITQNYDIQSQRLLSFFNYLCLVIFPRAFSPLIYGFRDQTLRRQIAKAFRACARSKVGV
ncbi:odorant receptor 131-2-like [Corythoichthys intestinalis]|uniref:odorant receptor 131-2-like n=1 Tax=Corythoichthys intestinalis TaxID=161448 RepID=UPI0025A5CDC2|nr:odorant receptor 131-2-like [Corythoichthys intestinalis]XP_061797590.1 odorant receptor 131-2-like [Nerophis lumbriciformis]